MKTEDSYIILKIRKRPWYVWFLRFVWLVWVAFWGDVASGSWKELEHRAFVISLGVFLISLILGFLLWLWGYMKYRKAQI